MEIVTLQKDQFDKLAKNNKYESYFQTSNYAEFELNNGYNVHYLGFIDNNKNLIGGAMCLYKNLFWQYNYAYIPRGLLIDYGDTKLVDKITSNLKKLLHKQNFVFIKIDPPIILNEYNKDGKILYTNNSSKEILNTLSRNNYHHLGFNLYYETKLPRWNLIIKLNKDVKSLYDNFDEDIKESIKNASRNAITINKDTSGDIDKFYEIVKNTYGRVGKNYFKNLYNAFSKDNKIDIFYAVLDSQQFVTNSSKDYAIEEEKNRNLANLISGRDSHKYNIEKVISDKMISDKNLHKYKKNIVTSTEFLKKYPNNKILAASFVIRHETGADCLILYEEPGSESCNGNNLLIYEMIKEYSNLNLKYLNLGPATGNFDKKNINYRKMINKLGFNTIITEYIGEFNLIINPIMYKIYEHKKKKKK